MDLEAFASAFFEYEQKHKLADWRISLPDGHQLAPWPMLRFDLFREASQHAGLYNWEREAPAAVESVSTKPGIRTTREVLALLGFDKGVRYAVKKYLPNSNTKRLLNAEYLVLPFYRRDAEGLDKFTNFIEAGLGNNVGVIGSSPFDAAKGWPRYTALNKHAHETLLKPATSKLKSSVTDADLATYAAAVVFCEEALGLELPALSQWPEARLAKFIAEYDLWNLFFMKAKAKKLILPFSGLQSIIGAAQANGITVCEVQHGLFNPYPMRFNWPGNPAVPYLPNEVWTWGDYWTKGFDLIANQRVRVMGRNAHLSAALVKTYTRNPKQITFIAQPGAGQQLFEAAVLTAQAKPESTVIFRLHPGDEGTAFVEQLAANPVANLEISTRTPDILTLLGESAVVVGAYSTTLIEAAALGTPSVVLKVSSWRRLEPLIAAGDAVAVDAADDVPAAIERARIVNSPDFYYAQPVDLESLLAN